MVTAEIKEIEMKKIEILMESKEVMGRKMMVNGGD